LRVKVVPTEIPEVLVLEPRVFTDARGFFFESFNAARFSELTGVSPMFVQDNHSRSVRNVLRGLHYQIQQEQGKLVRAIAGEVFDVAVDLREGSATFGRWVGQTLSADNRKQVWIPPGFAHGFLVLSEFAEIAYKTTDYWAPQHERCVAWNDPDLAIAWPLSSTPILSEKDAQALPLALAERFPATA
jgi:dTDP-4-dehydrorhamnose 3,5-epimerase